MPPVLWSTPVPLTAKPHNMMQPPLCFTLGMVFFGLWTLCFFLHTHVDHYGQTVLFFVSFAQRTFLQKVRSLSQCSSAIFSPAVFGRSGFLLGEQPFRSWWRSTFFTMDLHTFVPVASNTFPCCLTVALGCFLNLLRQNHFVSRTPYTSPSWTMRCLWCLYLCNIVCTDEHDTFMGWQWYRR